MIEASKITDEFRSKGFKNFDKDTVENEVIQAYNKAIRYSRDFEKIRNERVNSIALLGNSGIGKTHLLMAIANNLLARGVEVIYFPWVEGMENLLDFKGDRKPTIERMQQCEVLFLDDLFKGRDNPTSFQFETAWGILNYRYLNNKPILVSSERSISDLLGIDEAFGSRIAEMTRKYRVVVHGDRDILNYRLREDA